MIAVQRTSAVLTSALLSMLCITAACTNESSGNDDGQIPVTTGPADTVTDDGDGPDGPTPKSPSEDFDFVRSGLGESCLVTAHCDEKLGLICVDNTCIALGMVEADSGTAPVAPVRLGQVGESCRARSDCELNLACLRNTCVPLDTLEPSDTQKSDAGAPDLSLTVGQVGESCTSRADCAPGLACFNARCVQGSSGLAPTGKECVVIQCREALDCCPTPPATCATLEANCLASPGSASCTSFEANCVCDGSNYDCTANQCVFIQCREPVDCCPIPPTTCPTLKDQCDLDPESTACAQYDANCVCDGSSYDCNDNVCSVRRACTTDANCLTTQVCDVAAGYCVGCLADDDCPEGGACIDNLCESGCQGDEDCPFFNQCMDGECVEVGCQTDRECKVFTGDLQAVCKEGECQVKCVSDFECANNMVCVDSACVPVGCETDEECRLQLGNGGLATTYEVECKLVE